MYLFRNPGLKRILRYRMFNWGVDSMHKIIAQTQKFREAQEKMKMKASEKLTHAKTKIEQVKPFKKASAMAESDQVSKQASPKQ